MKGFKLSLRKVVGSFSNEKTQMAPNRYIKKRDFPESYKTMNRSFFILLSHFNKPRQSEKIYTTNYMQHMDFDLLYRII